VDSRTSPEAESQKDMLGAFILKGLTYDEILNETFLQM
jgi:hypothetical protein